MSSINELVKEVRQYLGMNQKNFSNEIGISPSHMSSIENGKDNPSTTLIKFICLKFNIDENWMMSGQGAMRPDWDILQDNDIITKYQEMKAVLDAHIKKLRVTDLKNNVEAFSYLVGLLTLSGRTSMKPQMATDFYYSIRIIMDTLERQVFNSYVKNILIAGKNPDYKILYEMRIKADNAIKKIENELFNLIETFVPKETEGEHE